MSVGYRIAFGVMASWALIIPAAQPACAEPSLRSRQWYLEQLHVPQAQQLTTGSGVRVAVIDSGVDAGHPELVGQVEQGVDLVGGTVNAWTDMNGHGTHMAGIIAAHGRKVLGVAPGVTILPVRVWVGDDRRPDDASVANGIRTAVDHGATVVNLSVGVAAAPSATQREAVAYALAHNAVVVASAGNTSAGATSVVSPASIPGIVAVTGTNQQGTFSPVSTSGPEAVLAAPAEQIVNIDSRQAPDSTSFSEGRGTSDSAAIVSGVVALIRAKYPQLDAANVINRLIRTADDAGAPGRDPQYGFGRVNVLRALTADVPPVTANPLGAPNSGTDATSTATAVATGPTAVADDGGSGGLPRWLQFLLGAAERLLCLAVALTLIAFIARRLLRRRRRAGNGPAGAPYHPQDPPGGPPTRARDRPEAG